MAILVRLVWPGLRLMILPFVWLAWFPALAIMLAGTGLILLAAMQSDGGSSTSSVRSGAAPSLH